LRKTHLPDRPWGGAGPPIVVYRFEDSRGAERLERHLAGWRGILQCDGYAAYRRLAEPDRPGGPVTLACCWSHLRQEFYKLHIAGVSQTATWTVERMADLWAVEEQIRGCDPQTRRNVRRQASTLIVDELQTQWEAELARISGKSNLRRRSDTA
jgi:transposase